VVDTKFRSLWGTWRNSSPEFGASSLHPEIYTARPAISAKPAALRDEYMDQVPPCPLAAKFPASSATFIPLFPHPVTFWWQLSVQVDYVLVCFTQTSFLLEREMR